jgi:O-methyltransferase
MDTTNPTQAPEQADLQDLYLQLLARSLTHTLYSAPDAMPFASGNPLRRAQARRLRKKGIIQIQVMPDREQDREQGKDWPLFSQTMVGMKRLESLRSCIETVIADDVPGDLIETGVWRGGASIFARGVLRANGVVDRKVYVADSFEGLPPPDGDKYPADAGAGWHLADELAVSEDEVRENFARYGLLDDQVAFLKGWFKDTLPTVSDKTWAIARLDGDMYESTMDSLTNLYDGLSPGGFLIIDDYSVEACKQAVTDFRRDNGISEPIVEVDWTGVYWRKSG